MRLIRSQSNRQQYLWAIQMDFDVKHLSSSVVKFSPECFMSRQYFTPVSFVHAIFLTLNGLEELRRRRRSSVILCR